MMTPPTKVLNHQIADRYKPEAQARGCIAIPCSRYGLGFTAAQARGCIAIPCSRCGLVLSAVSVTKYAALLVLFSTSAAMAVERDFYRDVYPFLKTNCIACHNKTTTKADLNMETPEEMIQGGDSGPSIVPGKSDESLIVKASLHQDDMEMPPPNNKSGAVNLSPAEIAILKEWIDQGAKSSTQQERNVVLKSLAASVDPIYCVAMTKDGRYAACGRSNQIFLYDLATRQLVTQISDPAEKNGAAHRALVQSLAFSPDGTRLASGSFREVKIWQLDSTKSAKNSPELASESASAEMIQKISESSKLKIVCSALTADHQQIATGCDDGSVRIWNAMTLKPVIELRGSVTLSKKMSELDWTIAAQALEQTFQKGEISRFEAQDKALDVLLGKAKEAIVTMKRVLPEKEKAVPPTTEARTAAEKSVNELEAKLADDKDSEIEKELRAAQDKLITAKMSEVSALAAVTAAQSNVKDAEDDVKRITASKAVNAKTIAAANAAMAAAKAAQDKATAEQSELKTSMTDKTSMPVAVCFSADAQRVASLFEDGSLRVWATVSGIPIEENIGNAAATSTLAAAPDGSFVATRVITQNVGCQPRWVLDRKIDKKGLFTDRVNAVRFSPDGKTLATGGGEPSRAGDVILLDVATGKATKTWKDKHTDSVLGLDFSPDGKRLASGAADKVACVTDVASGKQLNSFEGHTHHVMAIAFRCDGRVLATAGAEGTVVTWDLNIGERKKKIEGWTKEVTSLQFIGATNQLVASSGDNRVRIVTDDGTEVRSIANIPDYMQAVASSSNGNAIVGGGEDSLLRIWDASGKELIVFGKQ